MENKNVQPNFILDSCAAVAETDSLNRAARDAAPLMRLARGQKLGTIICLFLRSPEANGADISVVS